MLRRLTFSLLLCSALAAAAQSAPHDVDIAAPDGANLRATYYPAAKPGAKGAPAVLLLHMCNTDRKSWAPVAKQLAAAGISALTMDYRGFGESAGPKFDSLAPPQQGEMIQQKWPGDIDAAFNYLLSQPGVDKTRVGAGGGSCGVNNAVHVAMRHANVISLALLAGPADSPGVEFLSQKHFPVFTAAAADDQFDSNAPQNMQWLADISGNPRNKFAGFKDGKHGTEIFGPHPELPRQIVAWYVETLVKSPANPGAPVNAKKTPAAEFWPLISSASTVPRAVQFFHEARKKDPQAFLFPEMPVNRLGYTYLQAGQKDAAIAVFQLNTEAFPASANTYDSLSDAYLAAGRNDDALAAEQKCLELLPNDKTPEPFKTQIRQAAEEKIAKLRSSAK